MKHYYTDNSELDSKPTTFTYTYRQKKIIFTSDIGVFSKSMIDYGSRVLLEAITISDKQKSLLDVGCGYGTFGIALKKEYSHLQVDMVDVNDRAISLTKNNSKQNQLDDISIYKSYIYDQVTKTFDVIVTNPPIRAGKDVVHKILEEAYPHLNEQGELWVVIQKKQGAPSAKDKMLDVFGNVEVVKKDKGYYIFKSIKTSL